MIKKCQFYTAELGKRANYATSASFGKYMKSILVMTNDAKNAQFAKPSRSRKVEHKEYLNKG